MKNPKRPMRQLLKMYIASFVLLATCLATTAVFADNGPITVSLDGDWEFTYTSSLKLNDDGTPVIPEPEKFKATMPVPAYWDDHLDRLRDKDFWSGAKFNPNYQPLILPLGNGPPDADLLFLYGVGIYKTHFNAKKEWLDKNVTLRVGGVVLQAYVCLNGKMLLQI